MSTRSNIGYKDKNGITFVYCHNGGDVEDVGMDLLKDYNSFKKAKELVSNGNMSYPGSPYKNEPAETTTDIEEFWQEECAYLYDSEKDCWLAGWYTDKHMTFIPIEEAMRNKVETMRMQIYNLKKGPDSKPSTSKVKDQQTKAQLIKNVSNYVSEWFELDNNPDGYKISEFKIFPHKEDGLFVVNLTREKK